MAKGILYFAQNPAFQHLTKIGKTTKSDIKSRGLSGSNVPEDFKYLALLDCEDVDWAEKKVHEQFGKFRHATETGRSTEFYWSGCIDAAIRYAQDLKGVSDQTKETVKKIQKEEKEAEVEAGVLDTDSKEVRDEKLKRRQNFNFKQMGIMPGSILTLIKNPKIQVKVLNDKEVVYEDKAMSFSPITAKLIKSNAKYVQPTLHWNYEGKNLYDIYNETYPAAE